MADVLAKLTDAHSIIAADPGALRERMRQTAARRPMGEQVAATLQAAGRSRHTRRSYEHAIGLFLQYLEAVLGEQVPATWRPLAHNADIERQDARGRTVRATEWAFGGYAALLQVVQPGHVDGYRAWREAEGDSPNTASVRTYAVRTFLSVAYRDGLLPPDSAQLLGLQPYRQRQKRDTTQKGRRLAKAEVNALRAAVDASTVKGKRDLAILDLALFEGLRCAEIAELRLGDFRRDGGRWWLVVTGKGQKTRRLKLHDQAYQSLQAWLAASGRALGDDAPVFTSVNKADAIGAQALNTSSVGRLVTEYGALAGLAPERGSGRLAPHDLRRTAARCAYENGAPLPKIQAMLGHSSPETTMRYVGADRDDANTGVDYVRY